MNNIRTIIDPVAERPDWFGIEPLPEVLTEQWMGRRLRQGEIDNFISKGVHPLHLLKPSPVLVDDVIFNRDGSFDYARHRDGESGAVTVLTVAIVSRDAFVDVAAWHPDSNKMAGWNGYANIGDDDIAEANLQRKPIAVWRNVLEWLQAGRSGAVLLRPREAWHTFDTCECVIAADPEHAPQLRRLIWSPRRRVPIHVWKTRRAV